ncbi:hypothetical protein AAG587_08400 [Vreelandella neptunia]|uniref:hypothetical protein n=1 Tax=Vreelandella neptunia TaxID=115551 RepID=UPI00315AA24E
MNHEQRTINEGEPTPEFLNSEEEALFAQARLGEDAISFLNSDLGRVMRGFAEQEVRDAKDALLTTAADPLTPEGQKIIRDAQFKAAVANQFLGFIQEITNASEGAYQQLRQMRDQA